MYVECLELRDFRCYEHACVALTAGPRVLVGMNAQGKTNLLEALHLLATGGSHRVSSDAPLVRHGADAATVRAIARLTGGIPPRDGVPEDGVPGDRLPGDGLPGDGLPGDRLPADRLPGDGGGGPSRGRRMTVELEIRPGGRNRARVNGQPQPRARDAVGQIRAVLFAPEDLQIVRGDPGERRRFLDDLLAQRRPAYLTARHEYERVVRQRTALLRALRSSGSAPGHEAMLDTWDDALVRTGSTLLAARIAAVHALSGPVSAAYRDLAQDSTAGRDARLSYQLSTGRTVAADPGAGIPDPAGLGEELRAGIDTVARDERERGLTLVGPHRDDLLLRVGDLPAKGYASHGEQWSLTLALRLASRDVLAEVGEEPVVLLDDVFAELDDTRRGRLAARCAAFEQVIVTTAVDEDVPLRGPRHRVHAGSVTADAVQ